MIFLLTPVRDESSNYNYYSSEDLARLSFIRKAHLLGFSLKDIGDILGESRHSHSPCPLGTEDYRAARSARIAAN